MNPRLCAGLLFALSAFAQNQTDPRLCSTDSSGNRICVRTQPDSNICGYGPRLFGAQRPSTLPCNDVVVEKSTPGGRLIFSRLLAGESEEVPRQLFVDDRGNISILGTTWSSKYPVTADAGQPRYAGPVPVVSSAGRLQGGGDLFLTLLSPTGELVYSAFLGSPESDDILALETRSQGLVDVLVSTPGLQFPVASAPSLGGPVLMTIDMAKHAIMRSQYLPASEPGQPVMYSAGWTDNGTVRVVTSSGVFTYSRDGRSLARAPLAPPLFASIPTVTIGPDGDLWLTGATGTGGAQVLRLTDASTEVFRWSVPSSGGPPTILAPFFGTKGLVYLGGYLGYRGVLRSTTSNAMLRTPCDDSNLGFIAVFDRRDDLKMLSYFTGSPFFSIEKNGTVSAGATGDPLNHTTIDLTDGPKIGCVYDAFRSFSIESLALGQVVRIRGGGFGPSAPVAASAESGRFPKRLERTRVRVDDIDAPILAVARGEVVVEIPYSIRQTGVVPVVVEEDGERSSEYQITLIKTSPQLLAGPVHGDGTLNSNATPAAWGSTVSIWVTGAGPYTPSLADGEVANPSKVHRLELPVSVSFQISGPESELASIVYAGPVPGLIGGVSRIAFKLPRARPYAFPSIVALVTIGSRSIPVTAWIHD